MLLLSSATAMAQSYNTPTFNATYVSNQFIGTAVGDLLIKSNGINVFGGKQNCSASYGTHFIPWTGSIGILGQQGFFIRSLTNNANFNQSRNRMSLFEDYGSFTFIPLTNTNIPKTLSAFQISRGSTISDNWNYMLRLSNQWQGAGKGTEIAIDFDNGVSYTHPSRNAFGFRSSAEIAGTGGQGSFYRIGAFNTFGDGVLKYNELFRIRDNGQVSIGPKGGIYTGAHNNSLLSVAGKIACQKLVVLPSDFGNWPDYVFDKGYALMPLAEIEKFVIQNKHLPEVPSAKNIEEHGIDMEATQAILLKKIEELTLHMISINKKVEALSIENNILKSSK